MDEERWAEAGALAAVVLVLLMAMVGEVAREEAPQDPWPIGTDWTFEE